MSVNTIYTTLKDIMEKDGSVTIDDEGLMLIASLADGALRDALSLTEQILSNGRAHYSQEFIALSFGVVSHAAVKDICHAVIHGQVDTAILTIKDVYDNGFDLCQLMDALAERFRLLSLCAHLEHKHISHVVNTFEESDYILAKSCDKADLKRLFAMAIDGCAQVFQALRPIHALELFVLRQP